MQWEYKVLQVNIYKKDEAALRQLGKEGWELVAALDTKSSGGARFYLKRAVDS